MTPFLIAAIACGLAVFLVGATLRPWLDNKRPKAELDQKTGFATIASEGRPKAQSNYQSRAPLGLFLTAILMLLFVPLLEYIYIGFVHNDMNRQYFFDGPVFRQIVFGCVFGIFVSFWLIRGIVIEETKKDKQIFLTSVGKDENVEQKSGADTAQYAGSTDTKKFVVYNELPTLIALLIIFLVGVFDEETIARIARFGGNVKLPGGVEFAFGRNESRSSETSVAQLVPPANSQNSYAPPSVSQGLQSLAELGQTMRRDGLIYALRKRLVEDDDHAGKVALIRNGEKSAEVKLLALLGQQIKFADEVYANLAKCLIEENKQNLDYMTSGEKILPIAKKLNESLRRGEVVSDKEIDEIFPKCRNPGTADKAEGSTGALINGMSYTVDKSYVAMNLNSNDTKSLPYVWIAVANIFEYNHRYVAAIALLENWLRITSWYRRDKDMSDILEIRIRSMIGGYLYEWMNYQPIAKTQAVLEYYRINLDRTTELLNHVIKNIFTGVNLKKLPTENSYQEKVTTSWDCGSYIPNATWSESVGIPDKDNLLPRRMKLALIYSLLSMKQSWINAVLDGADYKDYKNKAKEYAEELREMNVKCMGLVGENEDDRKGENYVRVLRAQNLDAYARVMRANANLLQDAATRKSELSKALSAAEEGLELAKEIAQRDRDKRRSQDNYGVAFTTSGTPALEVFERLGEVIRRTNADLERL